MLTDGGLATACSDLHVEIISAALALTAHFSGESPLPRARRRRNVNLVKITFSFSFPFAKSGLTDSEIFTIEFSYFVFGCGVIHLALVSTTHFAE